jgi:hypothetical protein
MTSQEEMSRNLDERNEARQDLRHTLAEVNAKLESVESDLRPDHLIESHSVGVSLMAGALGFLLGSTVNNQVSGPVIIVALVSFALSRRSSDEWKQHDESEIPARR